MKPSLRGFFDAMEAYFAQPDAPALERLYDAHPGWDAARSRVALYGQFVRHHRRATMEKLFPLVRGAVGEARWTELVSAYGVSGRERPFEMNAQGEGFPAFLADEARRRDLPEFLPALARFEWTDFAVYTSLEPMPPAVERPVVNPTLVVLEHPFHLCAYVRAGGTGQPAPGTELALLWRHPERLVTLYQSADDRALLALKMAVEGLTAAQVSAATGVAEADIQATLVSCAADGLLLAPAAPSGG